MNVKLWKLVETLGRACNGHGQILFIGIVLFCRCNKNY